MAKRKCKYGKLKNPRGRKVCRQKPKSTRKASFLARKARLTAQWRKKHPRRKPARKSGSRRVSKGYWWNRAPTAEEAARKADSPGLFADEYYTAWVCNGKPKWVRSIAIGPMGQGKSPCEWGTLGNWRK